MKKISYSGLVAWGQNESARKPGCSQESTGQGAWAMQKFKRIAGHTTWTGRFLEKLSQA